MSNSANNSNQAGFTLVELSIVLVIIGLLVGGILVGQEMIKAAQVRSVITQMDKYNTAINVFKNKYQYLPGDLLSPGNFFTAPSGGATLLASTATVANGNGLVEDADSSDGGLSAWSAAGGEIRHFFYQMAMAGVVENQYLAPATYAQASTFPSTKLANVHVIPFGDSTTNLNYFELTNATSLTIANSIFPIDAFTIDSKMDDGNPGRGIVLARTITGAALNVATADGTCHNDGTDNTINTTDDFYASTNSSGTCSLRIQMN